jgi:hypothetical protein
MRINNKEDIQLVAGFPCKRNAMLGWGVQSPSETASESLNDDFSYDSASQVIIQTIHNLPLAHH